MRESADRTTPHSCGAQKGQWTLDSRRRREPHPGRKRFPGAAGEASGATGASKLDKSQPSAPGKDAASHTRATHSCMEAGRGRRPQTLAHWLASVPAGGPSRVRQSGCKWSLFLLQANCQQSQKWGARHTGHKSRCTSAHRGRTAEVPGTLSSPGGTGTPEDGGENTHHSTASIQVQRTIMLSPFHFFSTLDFCLSPNFSPRAQ